MREERSAAGRPGTLGPDTSHTIIDLRQVAAEVELVEPRGDDVATWHWRKVLAQMKQEREGGETVTA